MREFGLISTVVWALALTIVCSFPSLNRLETYNGKEAYRAKPFVAFLAVLPVVLWAGTREGYGYADTNAYLRFYDSLPVGLGGAIQYVREVNSKDPGFTLFSVLIKSIFGNSQMPFLMIIASIQCFAVAGFYRKNSEDFAFSLFLFIASAECFSWVFNGMRQFLAVVITLAGFRHLLDKKMIRYILVILLASTVHLTALIMIPIGFIVQGKPWNRKTLIAIAIAMLALAASDRFTNFLAQITQNTQYGESVATWEKDGANPIRVAVYILPTILSFFVRKRIQEEQDPVISICVNMSIISSSLWIIAMVTSGIHMGRLPIYVGLYNYILLPYLTKKLFSERGASVITIVAKVLYVLYYYYQVHIAWGAV